ncbi:MULTISPECIES: TetR-like C-terminal domain-containing protein [unclassified Microbacterium]|uniref:TetR/AcrR family transcriptional regulator n=1 Tax=unclassified Microbacterium TaxID=2609290 RepID=UPI00214BA143|nr:MULTISPECIES: TetR-like C-terminal domain-containing protein [unclassified Microbacterium]MCR2784345.1 WHG domain-containing protein [Microbacterium sp. zg.B96]MDL5350747.1 TetR-like C-terminal domain-containing protein [Microbacterium sp. zg-YB36]WIM14830.1 TetR-like C-terminal domain-containing protein [Microbacterium sp. zg-B96]
MPTPARTSLDGIVAAGRAILASDGLAALTMQAVADRVGVRAPSLYKRVRSRDQLLRLIATAAAHELGDRLDAIVARRTGGPDARAQLTELAHEVRSFAHARPEEYRLVFAPTSEATRPDPEALTHAVAPLLHITTELAGADDALEAARTVTAWATGFIGMELAGAFRLGGDVDRAYAFGIARLATALAG